MKVLRAAAALLCVGSAAAAEEKSNPLQMVLGLMDELTAKVREEGHAEDKAYNEYRDWCQETAQNSDHAIKSSTSQKTKLTAKIEELASDIEVGGRKIEDLTGAIAEAEAELKNATEIREKEAAEFKTAEAELADTVDTVGRALHILETEMAKNAASLAQVDTSNMRNAIQAINVVLDAAAFSTNDQKTLTAFVQSQEENDDFDKEFGAPSAEAYKGKSGGIIEILEDMKDKADSELSELRKAETDAKQNYNMLKQSLEAQLEADKKNLGDEKSAKAEAKEHKADAEGDLEMTVKELANNQKQFTTCQQSCLMVAADHEESMNSRIEELKVIAKAKQIISETNPDAAASFVQVSATVGMRTHMQMQTHADLARFEVVTAVKRLSQKHHSAALAQLAVRISTTLKFSGRGDQFGKVKSMLRDMITKLQNEAQDDAEEKAYCDEQMGKTEEKESQLEDTTEKLHSDLDSETAHSAEVKAEIQETEAELAALTKEQAEMDKIRQEENAEYTKAKQELELGLSGVRKALQVLRDYYGGQASLLQDGQSGDDESFVQQPPVPDKHHSKASGAGSNIIMILENVESDFATNLAKMESEEADAQSAYEKTTQENKVSKASKTQDTKFKGQEVKSLDTTLAELSSDEETSSTELAAVNEYYSKVKDRCVAKPESYEERKKRREAEIQGLKEALTVLKTEAAFVQRKRRSSFRGSTLSAQ